MYEHINKINGKRYIGITRQVPQARWGRNGICYKSSPYFYNAIVKYGWENFDHMIIAEGLSKADACELEMKLISEFKTQDKTYGYNILEGGTAPSMPDDIRQLIAVALRNNTNGKGHPCSEEKKRKISEAQRGRHLTEEHKRKLSDAKRGRSHKSPSDETRKKISNSHRKTPVYCLETGLVYPSIQECARQLDISATAVCACCRGRHKSVHGYHLRYYVDNDVLNA